MKSVTKISGNEAIDGRSWKDISSIISITIHRIRSHAIITDAIIQRECLKNNISEKTIRTIAIGTGKRIEPISRNNEE